MSISLSQILVWALVGLIAGSLVGLVVKGERKGFGIAANLALGLAGALIGGVFVRLFGLFPNLEQISISLRDIVAAVLGSLLVLLLLWLRQSRSDVP